jgi:peptide/nickel transport system substrate-binding protein
MLAFDLHDDALPGIEPNRDGLRNPFRDGRVREAVYRAVNVDLLVQKVLRGAGTATGTLFAPLVEGDVPELAWRRRYDPAGARELLAQAGWPHGFDVQFDCVNTGYREQGCRAMAAMLAQVGIRADLHVWPGTEFFPKITQGTIRLAEFGYTAATDGWQNLNGLLHSWDGRGAGTFNASRFTSPRLDALIDQIRTEEDPRKRAAMIGTVLRAAADELPYVPLYRPQIVWAAGRRVHPAMRSDDTIALRWTSLR